MYRVSVFTLGTTLSPYNSLHAYTNTRPHGSALSLSFFFFFSTLQLAAPLARLSFYSFRTRALAFTRTHAWSRTHATNDHTTTRVPSVHFSFLFFSLLFFSTTIIAWNRTRPVRPSRSSLPSRIKCYISAINNLLSLCRARWTNLRDVEPPSRAGRGWSGGSASLPSPYDTSR